MLLQSRVYLHRMWLSALLLAALGCSRSAVVVVPEAASRADEPAATAVARAPEGEGDGASFAFPEDAGGALLAKVLPPKETEAALLQRSEPPRRVARSREMKPPALPLPTALAAMPRLPAPAKSVPVQPRLVMEETLDGLTDPPILPQLPSLPDTGRVRVSSVDVNEPIALPILAKPVPDRASLDDPTLEASTRAALAATIPLRTAKAPFVKITVPDPYDRRRPETLQAPAEAMELADRTPHPPRK